MLSSDQLASMRATVAATLVDTCTIRQSTERTFNRSTGEYAETSGATVYTGACEFAPLGVRTAVVGDEPLTLHTYSVRLPHTAADVEVDHLITADTSNDPRLDGRTLRVVDVQGRTDPLSRVVIAEDDLG